MVTMNFYLLKGKGPKSVLKLKPGVVSGTTLEFQTTYHQIDEKSSSKTFLKEMMERIVNRYSSNATQRCCYLSKPLFDMIRVKCAWRSDCARLSVTLEGRTLKILKNVFSEKSVHVRVQFSGCNVETWNATQRGSEDVFSEGMRVEDSPELNKGGICVDDNVSIPKSWEPYLKQDRTHDPYVHLCCKISVEVSIPDFGIGIRKPGSSSEMIFNVTKKILTQGIQSDLVIIAGSGREIKCHKTFLAAHSPVLAAMFRNKCKEASENKIEMKETAEEVVEHFLAYLYCGELTPANESCQVALDLFDAGHKYEVASLEEQVKQILLQKPAHWFDVNAALRLFCLYGSLEGCDDLKKKALQVMKEKFEELEECDEYQQLFAKDPKGAMGLCKYLFASL